MAAPTKTPWSGVQRTASQTRWQSVTTLSNNVTRKASYRTNSFVELGAGLNITNASGQFVSANPSFTVTPTGAEARGAAHQVIVPGDIGSGEGVRVVMPGGEALVFQPLAIDYFDPVDGQGVLLDVVTNAVGWLVASNEIVFSNCFTHIKASIRLRNMRAGLESDLILHESPPEPQTFGLSSSARLEMLTEQLAGPVPTQRSSLLQPERDPQKAATMLEPHLVDTELTFGTMKMGTGRAFITPATTNVPPAARSGRVAKSFLEFDNRKIIIEAVEHRRVRPALLLLPPATKAVRQAGLAPLLKAERLAKNTRRLPALPVSGETREAALRNKKAQPVQHARLTAQDATPMQLASAAVPAPAFVLDYYLVGIYGETDFTFRSDETYWVSTSIGLSGTTTIEGGTVIKFSESSGLFFFEEYALVCDTTEHLPAVFTSYDDNSVGEDIGGSGSPVQIGTWGLYFISGGSRELSNVRFTWLSNPIAMEGGGSANDLTLRNVQVRKSDYVVDAGGTDMSFYNGLFVDCGALFLGGDAFVGQHLTIHNASVVGSSANSATLKNSLLVGVTDPDGDITSYTATDTTTTSDNSVFATVEGGAHYLAANSTLRNAGTTTGLDAQLALALPNLTTYAPEEITGTLTADRTLSRRAIRDTELPDRGYHYPAVDYLVRNLTVQNATLKMQNGVVVAGAFNSSVPWLPALRLNPGKLVSQGTATQPNRLLRASQVQEQVQARGYILLQDGQEDTFKPEITLRYTEMSSLADETYLLAVSQAARRVEISHSAFVNGQYVTLTLYGGSEQLVGLTNNLFRRVEFGVVGNSPVNFYAYNNLFKDGPSGFTGGNADWRINDNVFDHGAVYDDANSLVVPDKNAYIAGVGPLSFDANPVNLTSLTYASGPLGKYYISGTTLQNAGSRDADEAGLYHFTTTTSQSKEQATVVDIGLHYVAVGGAGNLPIDTDGEGLADYLEDQNGDGSVNATESSFLLTDTDGDKLPDFQELELGYDPLASDTGNTGVLDGDKDFDGDGLSNAGEINVYLSNPGVAKSLNAGVKDGHFKFAAVGSLFGPPSTEANLALTILGGGNLRLTLSDVPSGSTYHIYRCTGLTGSSVWDGPWSHYLSGTAGQTVWNFTDTAPIAFYTAGSAADTDGDGLSDGYEVLISKTIVDNPDSDGDGLLDGWEVQTGLNPNAPECPRPIYETAITAQSPSAWFKLNDTDTIPDTVSLADTGTGGGTALGNSSPGTYFAADLFDKAYGAVEFDENSDVLTAGDLINGGASVAPSVDQTESGSVSFLFRTLGALQRNKRYLLSQGTSTTSAKNAFHVYFDNISGVQGLKLQVGNATTEILPAAQVVFDAWYYLAITWKHDRNPEVMWYLGRVGGVLNTGSIDIQDLAAVHAVVGDNGSLYLGNTSAGAAAFQETIPPTTGTPYKGRLDQVAFWNSELTPGQITAQFNALPPAWLPANFSWNLMLPVNSSGGFANPPHVVEHSQLNAGFKYVDCTKKYFYRGDGNTMVFEVPPNGATDPEWPRSELRGAKADGSNHDWTPGSEGGTHILNGTCTVNTSGNSKIVIGQIHAKTSPAVPAIILYYDNRNDPVNNPNRPSIKVSVYDRPNGTDSSFDGDNNADTHYPLLTGASLNTPIEYQLKIDNIPAPVTLHVKVIYNGQTYLRDVRMSDYDSAWASTEFYFKAGCYYDFTTPGVDAKVTFSSLMVSP